MNRCKWAQSEDMQNYHDKEWGLPVHDDRLLFEFLILEGAQAGLSWSTILKRRDGYRKAFDNFDYKKISKYTAKDKLRLLKDSGIIRNRLKIASTIENAKAFLKIQEEFGSFDKYLWNFVNNTPINNKIKKISDIQANTGLSDNLSKDLKKRGFNFVGSTICYAFMQAIGMVNDHEVTCFRHKEVSN
jgi:DNA-3-methyladenine glycosylase I